MKVFEKYILKPRYKLLIYIFGGFFLFILITGLLPYKYENMPVEELNRYLFLIAFLTVVLIPIIWFVASKQIILENTSFSYSSGFAKSTISYDKIFKSDIRFVVKKYPDTIWEFQMNDNQIVSIPISYYSRKDLQFFASTLLIKSKSAFHSTLVHEIAQGIFPWYIK